jgi:hypothetical protein
MLEVVRASLGGDGFVAPGAAASVWPPGVPSEKCGGADDGTRGGRVAPFAATTGASDDVSGETRNTAVGTGPGGFARAFLPRFPLGVFGVRSMTNAEPKLPLCTSTLRSCGLLGVPGVPGDVTNAKRSAVPAFAGTVLASKDAVPAGIRQTAVGELSSVEWLFW